MVSKHLSGYSLAGTSTKRARVENDFYATPLHATQELFEHIKLKGSVLEPACGQGHITKVIKDTFPETVVTSTDLIQREDIFNVGLQGGINFLTHDYGQKFDYVITNPPFNLIQEFIEKSLLIANKKVIMFAKIQLLEGTKRRELFNNYPPKYVYVFSKRVSPLNNGKEFDENGKKWASTMCFAWFVWEIGFKGDPVIRWI